MWYLAGGGLLAVIAASAAAWWYRHQAKTARAEAKASREHAIRITDELGEQLEAERVRTHQAETAFDLERKERLAADQRHRKATEVSALELEGARVALRRLVALHKEDPDVVEAVAAAVTRRLQGDPDATPIPGGGGPGPGGAVRAAGGAARGAGPKRP